MLKTHLAIVLALASGCAGTAPPEPEIYPIAQDSCAPSCGWRSTAQELACARLPQVREYARQMFSSIASAETQIGKLPPSECVCLTATLSRNGTLSNIQVEKASSTWAAERSVHTLRLASPFPPVPMDAACVLDSLATPFQINFGGGRI